MLWIYTLASEEILEKLGIDCTILETVSTETKYLDGIVLWLKLEDLQEVHKDNPEFEIMPDKWQYALHLFYSVVYYCLSFGDFRRNTMLCYLQLGVSMWKVRRFFSKDKDL